MATLADALRRFGAAHLATHALNTPQAKAWRAIVACRTAALGGQHLACDTCDHRHWQYHSCRNRHCPQCGARAKDAWLQGRLSEVLPVPYAHLVFTLPHALNGLYGAHPRWVIDTLFACAAQTLSEFAANDRWMGDANGTPAFSLVLHTCAQDLRRHIHLHAVMACGTLTPEGRWSAPRRKPDFLFPVHALSKVFRGKFMAALAGARQDGKLERDPQGRAADWRERHLQLYKHGWVVYAKTPMGGPAQVLEYLGRYTHRTAIGNERIRCVDAQQVAFTVRADDHGGKHTVRLEGAEFVRRFLLHILPTGIKRIRHYGILAPACKKARLGAARLALRMPVINPQALESARAFMRRVAMIDVSLCPGCKKRTAARHRDAAGTTPFAGGGQFRDAPEPGAALMHGSPHPFPCRRHFAVRGGRLRGARAIAHTAYQYRLAGTANKATLGMEGAQWACQRGMPSHFDD